MKLDVQIKKTLEARRSSIYNSKRICLYPGCDYNAIGSHVLQRAGILSNIVDSSNHFYSIKKLNIFEMNDSKHFTVEKVGINDGYKFLGFCSYHDDNLFRSIETHPIDLDNSIVQALFSYRTLCLELRSKEIELEIFDAVYKTLKELRPMQFHYVDTKPIKLGIQDLKFFKRELEIEIIKKEPSRFIHRKVSFNEFKICFSASLTIHDHNNPLTHEEDKYGNVKTTPLASNILNCFPYQGKSQIIISMHKDYPCHWATDLTKSIVDTADPSKILSDILTYRLEFWGIQPKLYESISKEKKSTFMKESEDYYDDFSFYIKTNFNLFD